MRSNIEFGGVVDKHAPLFSFYSIFDIDIGLVNVIKKRYLNPKVFNTEFFDQPRLKIISEMYRRKEYNPLTVFAKDDISKEDLDAYYDDFLDKEYEGICDDSVITEVINYIDMFRSDRDINPTILCYRDYEVKIVKEEPRLSNAKILRLQPDGTIYVKDQRLFSEFYCKMVEEVDLFDKVIDLSFYISSFGPNFDYDKEDNPTIKITNVIKQNIDFPANTFNIYDLYNGKYFEKL